LIFSANSIPRIVTAGRLESFEPEQRPNPLFYSPVKRHQERRGADFVAAEIPA